METPILDAFRQFRENRQQRVENRRGMIRELLSPITGYERPAGMPEPEPATRIGKFLRSLGAGTSRQDYLPTRKNLLQPAPRQEQQYANGPDVGADAMKRDYDGDGNPAPAKTPALTASMRPDNPAMTLPAPVQGGTQNLPAVPASPEDGLRSRIATLDADIGRLSDLLVTPNATDADTLQRQAAIVAKTTMRQQLAQELESSRSQQYGSLAGVGDQITEAAMKAARTGNWGSFEAGVRASQIQRTDKDGQPIPIDIASMARPAVNQHAAEVFSKYGNLANTPAAEQASVLTGVQYAYPVDFSQAAQAKRAPTPEESMAEVIRISNQMNMAWNVAGDPAKQKYFDALAMRVVGAAGGRFGSDLEAWMDRSANTYPSMPPAAPNGWTTQTGTGSPDLPWASQIGIAPTPDVKVR